MEGDFTQSHEKAMWNKENASRLTYDQLFQNCAQSVYSLLLESCNKKNMELCKRKAQRALDIFLPIPDLMHDAFDDEH